MNKEEDRVENENRMERIENELESGLASYKERAFSSTILSL